MCSSEVQIEPQHCIMHAVDDSELYIVSENGLDLIMYWVGIKLVMSQESDQYNT